MPSIIQYILLWFPLPLIAIFNGAIREKLYKIRLGDLASHQVSTVSALMLFSWYLLVISTLWRTSSAAEAWTMGFIWFMLTIAFEFLFMHFYFKVPYSRLINDYKFWKGRLWILVLLWTIVAPYLCHELLIN